MEKYGKNWHHTLCAMNANHNEKFEAMNRLLEGDHVLVHLNTKAEGLDLPRHLLSEPTVTLKLSRWFKGAMVVEPDRVVAELLFNDRYFTCVIPLASVWGVSADKGENLVWPSAFPAEVAKALALTQEDGTDPESRPEEPSRPAVSAVRERPKLRRIK